MFSKKFLGAVIIIKNEAPYIKEWVDFHMAVGFEHFFIYDNESTDNTREILKPYIESGVVEYIYWPGKKQQMAVYNHALKAHKSKCKWLAFIDADEFVVPVKDENLPTMIRKIVHGHHHVAQIICPWIMYGTNGHETKPNGLVIENYTTHRPFKHYGLKSILNPKRIKKMVSPHQGIPKYFCYTIDTNGKKYPYDFFAHQWESDKILPYDKIRVNHYYTKSVAEYHVRHLVGSVNANSDSRSDEELKEIMSDANIQDDIMRKYIKVLKNNGDS